MDVLGGGEHPGGAPNDDAPAVGDGVVVGLEQDLVVHDGAEQLGALGGPEQHRPVLGDEVHREEFQLIADTRHQSTQRDALQQIPTLVVAEYRDRALFVCHVQRLPRQPPVRKGRTALPRPGWRRPAHPMFTAS